MEKEENKLRGEGKYERKQITKVGKGQRLSCLLAGNRRVKNSKGKCWAEFGSRTFWYMASPAYLEDYDEGKKP